MGRTHRRLETTHIVCIKKTGKFPYDTGPKNPEQQLLWNCSLRHCVESYACTQSSMAMLCPSSVVRKTIIQKTNILFVVLQSGRWQIHSRPRFKTLVLVHARLSTTWLHNVCVLFYSQSVLSGTVSVDGGMSFTVMFSTVVQSTGLSSLIADSSSFTAIHSIFSVVLQSGRWQIHPRPRFKTLV